MQQQRIALVLNEMEQFLKLGNTFLEREDVEIVTATGQEEALKRFRVERPDVVVLDSEFESEESSALCRALKGDEWFQHIPILILLQAGADEEEVGRWMEIGCADFVRKPIQDDNLMEKTARLLDLPIRRYLRAAVEMEVTGGRKSYRFSGKTLDISVGGMLLETESPMRVGDTLTVRFFLPVGESEIETTAQVVREVTGMDYYRYGLSFLDLTEATKATVARFVDSQH